MPAIKSKIDVKDQQYKSNLKEYEKLLKDLKAKTELAKKPESKKAIEKTRERNKFLTYERIEKIIDPGTSTLEIANLAGINMYEGIAPGAGISTCIAVVSGKRCVIIANNPCIKGGTYFPMTAKKHLRALEIALENKLPCIYLVDSGGAYLPLQAEVFPDKEHFGRIFFLQSKLSAEGVPQIACVLGSCTAGGAYVPAMSEQSIMVRGNARIYLAGPPLVKAATGEEVTDEELGGADVHCKISGLADYLCDSEEEALLLTRDLVKNLAKNNNQYLQAEQESEEPLYAPEEIYGIVGTQLKKLFSAKEVIARLVDGSRFEEFKSSYASSIKCGFAHIKGFRVGIIANNGILFNECALKATHFIQICSKQNTPLLFLQNTVGFMVGKQYEHKGIAKDGAKMVTAVATTQVPKFTLICGGSFGAGNYAMCGRAYEPRFLFTWPNSRISVMGGEQAAKVLAQVKSGDSEKLAQETLKQFEDQGNPYYATARLWDDGIIDPLNTRDILASAFASSLIKDEEYKPGIFRM